MLPFTRQEFFGVFAAYNTSVWPTQIVLCALTVAMVAMALGGKGRGAPWISLGLALLWVWTGVAYHWWKFTEINAPAWVFGALFVVEGALFARALGIGERPVLLGVYHRVSSGKDSTDASAAGYSSHGATT